MKNELTHEQAALLSLIADEVKRNDMCRAFDSFFLEDFEDENHPLYYLVGVDDDAACLTDAGQKALAAYKETWVPVRREHLALILGVGHSPVAAELLQSFEARISQRLEAANALRRALEEK